MKWSTHTLPTPGSCIFHLSETSLMSPPPPPSPRGGHPHANRLADEMSPPLHMPTPWLDTGCAIVPIDMKTCWDILLHPTPLCSWAGPFPSSNVMAGKGWDQPMEVHTSDGQI